MDAGDEAATELSRAAKDMAQAFLRFLETSARTTGGKGGLDLAGRAADFIESMRLEREGAAQAEADGDGRAEGGPDGGGRRLPEHRVMCAADLEELSWLSRELAEAGLEHYFDPQGMLDPVAREDAAPFDPGEPGSSAPEPGADGLFRIYLPDREPAASIHAPFSSKDRVLVSSREGYNLLQDAEPDMVWLIDSFSRDETEGRAAMGFSCSEAGGSDLVPEVDFDPSSADNVRMDFVTVKWDREADIIEDNLAKLGIPFAKEPIGSEMQRFSLHPGHAAAAKQLIDGLSEHVTFMSPRRVANYDELAEAAAPKRNENGKTGTREAFVKGVVPDAQAAAIVKEELRAAGIDYESYIDKATGDESIVVAERDIDANRAKLREAASSLPAVKRTAADRHRHAVGKTRSYAREEGLGYDFEARETGKPVADERMARSSARAQQRHALARERAQRRSK